MEEFEKIDWIPNVEDIIDVKFLNEQRLQNEGAMYKIMNGIFQDPFQDLKPRIFKPQQNPSEKMKQGTIDNQKKDVVKRIRTKPGRKKKK